MVPAVGEAVTASAPFIALEVIGTIAFAISGVMAAARARMDWLGAVVLALAVAIGGGTVRDLLLGQVPVAWLTDSWTVLVAMGTALAVLVILRLRPRTNLASFTPIVIADAAGLSTFVIVGTQIGLDADIQPFFAVMLGVLTGVGGGVIRDVLTGTRPMVLVGQIYAVAGIAGGTAFVLLLEAGVTTEVAIWVSVFVAFAIRMVAVRRNWQLPLASTVSPDDPG